VKRLIPLLRDRRGVAIAEYGLIVAIAGATLAVASLALGTAVSDAIAPATTCPAGQISC
jgi:Flp pilus assembly pilin Flp